MRMNTGKIIEQIRNILWESDELQKLNDTSIVAKIAKGQILHVDINVIK